ncbi:hypothetical protein EDF35_2838 [Rathayibacter sp. PhB151]|uniref:hypothetical protein n=1 Tax=Rathayibacter sp. PhB151 TaxID=2485189 RepID=UPI001062DAEA|nr:hypothetical protein [Rathayibacter sp. PhB151]TDX77330.1 hypothetical protein EDF35_2838 [Rathayibacter sp. PhB151]
MRNTRTVAACVAATTLFGLLSATPALASELDRGDASIVQGQESSGSGLGLLGHLATDAAPARPDRGDAGMLGSPQPGGPDAPLPARPVQEVPTESTPAPTPGFSATLEADRRLIVSLPMERFSSGQRYVFYVDGEYIGETSADGQIGGVHLVSTEGPDAVARFRIDAGRNGGRVEVRRYFGRLDLGRDTEPREETVFDQQVAVSTEITATLVDGKAVVSVPEKFLAANQLLVVGINTVRAEIKGDTAVGVDREWKEGTDRLFEIPDVKPGEQLDVWEFEGEITDPLTAENSKGRLFSVTL